MKQVALITRRHRPHAGSSKVCVCHWCDRSRQNSKFEGTSISTKTNYGISPTCFIESIFLLHTGNVPCLTMPLLHPSLKLFYRLLLLPLSKEKSGVCDTVSRTSFRHSNKYREEETSRHVKECTLQLLLPE